MSDSIYTALTGAIAQSRALEVAADNLANVHSSGFKGVLSNFEKVTQTEDNGEENVTRAHVQLARELTDFSPGMLQQTDNPMDLALGGNGFFVVQTPQGERLARATSLVLGPDRDLQTLSGQPIMGQGGLVQIPYGNTQLRIDRSGAVYSDDMMIDQLRVVDVNSPHLLQREAHGVFNPGDMPLQPVQTQVHSGAVERSNINPTRLMTDLIFIERAYEMYVRSIEMVRGSEQKLTNEVG